MHSRPSVAGLRDLRDILPRRARGRVASSGKSLAILFHRAVCKTPLPSATSGVVVTRILGAASSNPLPPRPPFRTTFAGLQPVPGTRGGGIARRGSAAPLARHRARRFNVLTSPATIIPVIARSEAPKQSSPPSRRQGWIASRALAMTRRHRLPPDNHQSLAARSTRALANHSPERCIAMRRALEHRKSFVIGPDSRITPERARRRCIFAARVICMRDGEGRRCAGLALTKPLGQFLSFEPAHRSSRPSAPNDHANVGAAACHRTRKSISTRTILSESFADSIASSVNVDVVTT